MKAPLAGDLVEQEPTVTATVPKLIDAVQIAELLGVSERHFRKLVHDGIFPRGLLVGACVRWPASDYTAYVERLREQRAKRKRYA